MKTVMEEKMKHALLIIIILLIPLFLVSASYQFARELYEDGLYEEAIVEFQKVIDEYPTSAEAETSLFYIGESYRMRENWQEGEKYYARLLRAYPGSDEPDRYQYYLALMQYKQRDYAAAIQQFGSLIENYPNSEYSRKSLVDYVSSYLKSGDNQGTILQGERLVRNYDKSEKLPALLLIVARASFAANIPEKGKQIMKQITDEYPESEARWQMIDLQMELLEKEKGAVAVIIELDSILEGTVPRVYEKLLREKLVNLYRNGGNYQMAMQELELMIEKYNNADNLAELMLLYTDTALELKQYRKVADSAKDFQKVFRESELKGYYELDLARASYYLGNFEQSQQEVEGILAGKPEQKLQIGCLYLLGRIAEQQGRYREAIRNWQQILPMQPENAARILLSIGDIYRERFFSYNSAMNFYRQVITNYSEISLQQESIYKTSLCYEALGNEEEALRQLSSINVIDVADGQLRQRIEQKREYIRRYQLQDFENGFSELLTALSGYLESNNRALLQQQIAEIMAYDLKEYEQGAALLTGDSPELSYRKALLLLRLGDKYDFEQRDKERDTALLQVNSIIFNLKDVLPADRSEELKIKKLLIASGRTAGILSMLESYVRDYPAGEARNQFILELAEEYKSKADTLQLVQAWQQLELDSRIESEEYYEVKILLAEQQYSGSPEAALELYSLASDQISISQPEVWYHYARVEYSLTGRAEALQRLQFLVDNVPGFKSYYAALNFLAESLRQTGKHREAIQYALYIPAEQRSGDFYAKLADDYLVLGDKEKAKESLMYIQDKDNATLLKLANLQYETKDFSLALYSYGVLQDKGELSEVIYQRSGDIYYEQLDYQAAIGQYESYLKQAEKTAADYVRIAARNVVCYYRIKNRPKAEELEKKYKDVLDEAGKQEIALAEGIYYTDIDSKKAEKAFNKLLKEELDADQMIRTYFWRGVLYLKYKNVAKAKEDFSTVAGATNPDFVNQAKFKLGLINFSENNFKEALDNYYYVIEHDEDGSLALEAAQNFAKVCKTIEEWEKAISAYEIILEKWGDQGLQGQTIFDIAFCYYRDKRYGQSIEMFGQALELLSERELLAEAQYWIGMSYYGMDDFEQAVTELLKVGYSYESYTQWAASAELQAGESYQKLDNYRKAKRIYERVIEKYGINSQWGTLAKEKLQAM
jgi:tetratricopeptide (TPR) repeat protein